VIASTEISFQFSLYHAPIYSDDLQERERVFGMLKKLYDVRSTTVHGGALKKKDKRELDNIQQNWSYIEIAKSSLTY
jgi:hypothetical protein